jgi:AcrR family transcriptional regulator
VQNSTRAEIAGQGRRTGRRPGENRTREAIAAAAAALFAERGFDRTSVRAIAREAGVDPALVTHYFGSKQRLFVEVSRLPIEPEALVAQVVEGPRRQVGLRLATLVLGVLETPEGRERMTALVRAATSEPAAAEALRRLIENGVVGPVAATLGADRPELRTTLAGSQVIGMVMARYVVGVEPLASAPADEVARAIAPTLQRYLTAPL